MMGSGDCDGQRGAGRRRPGPVWDEIVSRHGLAATAYRDVSSWAFGDAVFSWDYDLIADGSKARRHGFHGYVETAEMFTRIFDDMRARKIIPAR
jgi:hypothetical protein